ncbi:MAG: carboxypeptidase regulatory-like domain-containing protein [Terriglobales bacterium]
MRVGSVRGVGWAVVVWMVMVPCHLLAQEGSLHGHVTDPSGAVIPQATVTATSGSGQPDHAVTDAQGNYEIKGLAPGNYAVNAQAKGFAKSAEQTVAVAAGEAKQFDVALEIAVKPEKVEVQGESATVSTEPSNNASALVIKGKDLEALPDDPDELSQDLQALAGPSAGPNGGQIYIDGFTGGQLPPKASIREIRINQNPFSSEYDKLGYGRIEIFTKPGSDKFHGQFMVDGNDSAFNSLNPFVTEVPAYHSVLYDASIGGPLSKKASFFFTVEGRNIDDSNIVNATVLDPPFTTQTQFTEAVPNPRSRLNLGPRIDYQISKNNTLTARYQFFRSTDTDDGIGQFSLLTQGYDSTQLEHTFQVSDTQVVSPTMVNETRFQFVRDENDQNPGCVAPSTEVPGALSSFSCLEPTTSIVGAVTGGGNSSAKLVDDENRYELQNYTSIAHGNHLIKFGGRLRASTDSNSSNSNFNGTFTFPSLTAYETTVTGLNLPVPLTPAQSRMNCATVSSNPTLDCGASQFSVTTGQALSEVSAVDVGLYALDDWRIRPNMTLSYGLRFETQNNIHDHADWAPRLAFAWGLERGKKAAPKTVLRAGSGLFYERFASSSVLQAQRLNGVTQLQFVVANPDTYPNIPTLSTNTLVSPTIYQISPTLRAPWIWQSAVSIERQVTTKGTMAVTYLNSRGEHQLFLRNINAPLPGTFDPNNPGSGVRPLGGTDNIYQYDSEGVFRQNQLIVNARFSLGAKVSVFGFYSLNYSNSDLGTGGGEAGANFLTNQYDPMADYGRSAFDVRHRGLIAGSFAFPYAIRLSPFMLITSGSPFDITAGQDLNGDSIFNDRPGLVSTASCAQVVNQSSSILCTPLGTFNTLPSVGEKIVPVNSGTGPTRFTLNLRLSKTFGFGKETKGGTPDFGGSGGHGGRGGPPGGGLGGRGLSGGGGGRGMFGGANTDRRYNLTFTVSARNVLNRVNLAAPVGSLSSPLFGESNQLAGGPYSSSGANRRIDLQMLFSF